MKCVFCGNEIPPHSCKCEACGCVIQNGRTYPNAIAAFLDKAIYLKNNKSLRRFDLIRIFLINITIFTVLLNAILYMGCDIHVIWFQYVLSPLLVAYHIAKGFYCARTHLLRNIRKIFYLLMITLIVSGISLSCISEMLLYAIPVCLILLNLLAVLLILGRFVNSGSFALTLMINTVINMTVLLVLYFHPMFPWNNGVIVNIIALAFSVFLLINHVLASLFLKRYR